ncbi:MAG: phospholipase D family protein [Chitinophagaceae bacterium]|nr:phospholipase D family protein [Chitinophagaceae bacterium]
MNKLITKLSDNLIPDIKMSDEIWIAVALLNSTGLKFITDKLPEGCIQSYLVGVDLPTEPKALWTLFEWQLKSNLTVNLYTDKEYFHPKLYLFRKRNSYKGFIGSANCTNGGLNDNIELTVSIDDQEICKELKVWFEKLSATAKPLTKKFLQTYQDEYSARRERKRDEERAAKREKQELNEEYEATLTERNEFIRVLKNYRRKATEYNDVVAERKATVKELRSTLDYPNFSNIDIDSFFAIWELGHIIALPKPTIKREIKKFSKLLSMLCDEQTDIAVRYNRALEGDLKIRGINEGLISKLLVIHNPDIYFVKNDKTTTALKKYGIELPRGLSRGDKYKITCKFLRQICKETDIENLAVLDYYLYIEGNDE